MKAWFLKGENQGFGRVGERLLELSGGGCLVDEWFAKFVHIMQITPSF